MRRRLAYHQRFGDGQYSEQPYGLVEPKERAMQPRVTDNDQGEITVSLNGKELRGWSYASDDERRAKVLQAREYVEGWCDGREAA